VTVAILILAGALACDGEARIAQLGRGVCGLEPAPDGVRARPCDDSDTARDVTADDGVSTWMGLSTPGACGPAGLVRFDRARAESHAFRGTDAGPCGFRVHDLLIRDGTLWVATDLGVSRLRLSPDEWDEWTHYALTADGVLEETACGALLMPVAEAARAPGGEDVARILAAFRPRFVRRLPRGMRPASREARRTDEQALGDAERAGAGRGAHVHPRSLGGPEPAEDGGGEGGQAAPEVRSTRKGVP
jgi:hypothetical protein